MLGFLHTAASAVDAFGAVLATIDPAMPSCHRVAPELLAEARAAGSVTPALAARVAAAIDALRADGARVVLCTCSTIGAAAEAAARGDAPVLRVDRPMADAAVRHGARIAVVAALTSTLAPTIDLLHEVACAANRVVDVQAVPCTEAWAAFERGALDDYIAQIAAAARRAAAAADVVVLAQASMAPAGEQLADLPVPVLASPRLGVAAAVQRWRARP